MTYRHRNNQCCKKKQVNLYKDRPRPKWQQCCIYILGISVILFICMWILRDTAPVLIQHPHINDLKQPPGSTVGLQKMNDVYWRMKIRHVNQLLTQECTTSNYSLFTHKNIELDTVLMEEAYIHTCEPSTSILNARAVFSGTSTKYVRCQEQYASITKIKERKYPFSLKYISGTTFLPETKVIRTAQEACQWLHAIDIVESRWD